MANEDQLQEQPNEGGYEDVSAFEADEPIMAIGSDDEALRKMGRRTSAVGRIGTILLLLGVASMVGLYLYTQGKYDEQLAALERINALEDGSQVAPELRALLPEVSDPDLRETIVRNLGRLRDTESVPALTAALDEGAIVRRSAAIALARIGRPEAESARPKLLEVLAETDERDRAEVVWALAALGESQASEAIIEAFMSGRLQDMPGFDPKVITDVLGPARLSSDELLTHEREAVRVLTAQALAETASPDVVEPLSRLLEAELGRANDDQSDEVIRSAAAGLGRTGDPRAARPLFTLLQSNPSHTQGVLDALKQSAGAPEIATLMQEATDTVVKRQLARLLAGTRDPRGADALATLLEDEDMETRATAATALAQLGDDRSVETLAVLAASNDEGVADAALDSLGDLGSSDATPGLLALLPASPCPEPGPDMPLGCFRRAAILSALGQCGDTSAARRIEMALETEDSPPAAEALGRLRHEGSYAKLRGWVVRPRDVDMTANNAADRSLTNEDLLRKRRGAIRAMAFYGDPEASEDLMQVVEDNQDDYELRAVAAASLGVVATPEVMRAVITKVADQRLSDATRRYYVQALWQKPTPELNGALLDLIASEAPTEVRRAAALAVGYSGDESVNARLIAMLDDESTRAEAAFAISLGGSDEAAHALVAALGEDNDAREILQYGVMSDQNDWFNLLTEQMFETGQIWRRLAVGRILSEGDRQGRYGYAWLKTLAVLRSGWDGPGGVRPHVVRNRLWDALTGEDTDRRDLVVHILGEMPERGLLIRARDEGGPGSEAAREMLSELNRPANPLE